MRRRVAITGIGLVTAIGDGGNGSHGSHETSGFWEACLRGASRVEPVPAAWRAQAELTSQLWSPLPELDLASYEITRLECLQQDTSALMAWMSAFQALRGAGLRWEPANAKRNTFQLPDVDSERVSVSLGTGIGGVSSLLSNYQCHVLGPPKAAVEAMLRETSGNDSGSAAGLERLRGLLAPSASRMSPLAVPMAMPNNAAAALSIKLSLNGPSHTYCSACAAGTVALGEAFRDVREGRSDLALAGGTEYMDDSYGGLFRAFDLAKTLVRDTQGDPAKANRPFDRQRTGFLFSQGGAAVMLFEELEHARRRGAPVLAEVSGFAETSDAYNVVALDPGGRQIARAVQEALADAGLAPEEIDYVNAHGTGTLSNDETEAAVIGKIFGPRVLVNSTKSLLGHTLGASGAIEAAVTALSLHHQTTHACLNLEDPLADLGFVRRVEPFRLRAALTQSFAFGGHNAALVLRMCES